MATASTGHNKKYECDNCREAGLLKDAVSFCYECDLRFCVACNKLHVTIAPGHVLDFEEQVNKVAFNSSDTVCVKHSKEITRYYCQAHDVVICKICKQSEHFKCAVQDVSIVIDIFKDMYNITGQLVKLREAIDKLKDEKQRSLDTYSQNRRSSANI